MNSKINAERREEYHYYKAHGICVSCHSEEAAKGRSCCLNCLSIKAEQQRKRKSLLSEEEQEEMKRVMREKSQALRDYRKANGLCTICGKPAYENHSTCYEHYLYHKRYSERRSRAKKKGYSEQGLCRICGKPTAEGKKYCAEHLEQYREKARCMRARKNEKPKDEKHVWSLQKL